MLKFAGLFKLAMKLLDLQDVIPSPTAIDGKKSYLVVVATLLYCACGAFCGFLDPMTAAMTALAALGFGAHRSALQKLIDALKSLPDTPDGGPTPDPTPLPTPADLQAAKLHVDDLEEVRARKAAATVREAAARINEKYAEVKQSGFQMAG